MTPRSTPLGVVRVVGTGLLGTSVALGLRSQGVDVLLADPSPTARELACDLGAGRIDPGPGGLDRPEPELVVVAAPPDVTAAVVLAELAGAPSATVTDVASIKAGVLHAVLDGGGDASRYVGGHPMAGRERSGAVAARGDLFLGRPWVICAGPKAETPRVELVRALATTLGADAVDMSPADHDAAVALVSHMPQVIASLVASRLREAPEASVAIAGQGLRDLTRIAGSDPSLWAKILTGNAAPVAAVLADLRTDLDVVLGALQALAEEEPQRAARGARAEVARTIAAGNTGRDRLPGKHGARPTTWQVVTVAIPDEPGALGRVFADIGEAGVNVEELSLEHAPGRAVGLLEIAVLPAARGHLEQALTDRGWLVVG